MADERETGPEQSKIADWEICLGWKAQRHLEGFQNIFIGWIVLLSNDVLRSSSAQTTPNWNSHFSAGFLDLDMTCVKRIPIFDRQKHAHTGRIFKKKYQNNTTNPNKYEIKSFFIGKIIVCHHSSLLSMYYSANVYFFYGCHKEIIFWQHVEVLFQL